MPHKKGDMVELTTHNNNVLKNKKKLNEEKLILEFLTKLYLQTGKSEIDYSSLFEQLYLKLKIPKERAISVLKKLREQGYILVRQFPQAKVFLLLSMARFLNNGNDNENQPQLMNYGARNQ